MAKPGGSKRVKIILRHIWTTPYWYHIALKELVNTVILYYIGGCDKGIVKTKIVIAVRHFWQIALCIPRKSVNA